MTPRCLHRRLCGFFLEVESLGMARCLNNRLQLKGKYLHSLHITYLSPFYKFLSQIKRAVFRFPCLFSVNNVLSKWTCRSHLKKLHIWMFPKIVGFPRKSSILRGFSIIFTLHFGVPLFLETTTKIPSSNSYFRESPCCCLDSSVFSSSHSALWVYKSCPPGGVDSYILQKGNNRLYIDTYDVIVQYIYIYIISTYDIEQCIVICSFL